MSNRYDKTELILGTCKWEREIVLFLSWKIIIYNKIKENMFSATYTTRTYKYIHYMYNVHVRISSIRASQNIYLILITSANETHTTER